MRRTADNIKDPLFRYFEREVVSGAALLKDVRNDLNEVFYPSIFFNNNL